MQNPARHRSLPRRSRAFNVPVLVAGGAIVLAACGGSDANQGGAELPIVDDTAIADDTAAGASNGDAGPALAPVAGQVDLVGPDVVAASEIETNLLPSVVIDDVQRGIKVNFRNLVPQDKPILLWAYAPF